jgi:RNA polymerase sigma factor (sigma-70 family)
VSIRALARRSTGADRVFESLYRRHAADIYRYALAMLDRSADAEDATQTTFMNAYRALERGERPRDPGPWLRAIALNVCREHYRRASRRPDEVSLNDDPGELVLDPPTPAIGDVIRGLSHLPFSQRAAIVMREFEGRSVAEIADGLGVSISAVEALLFRARRGLREQLEGTLTCAEAERATSLQLDAALPRAERGPLRAHLRACPDCATLARRLRAQRTAIKSLALIPVPATLTLRKLASAGAAGGAVPAGATGGGTMLAAATGSLVTKVAAVTVIGATAVGVGYETLRHHKPRPAVPSSLASVHEQRPLSLGVEAGSAGRANGSAAAANTTSGSGRVRATVRGRFGGRHAGGRAVGKGAVRAGSSGHRSATSYPKNGNGQALGHSNQISPSSPGPTTSTTTSTSTSTSTTTTASATGNGNGNGKANGKGDGKAKGHAKTAKPNKGSKSNGHGNGNKTTTTTTTTTTTATPTHGNGKGNGNGNGHGQTK